MNIFEIICLAGYLILLMVAKETGEKIAGKV